MLNIKEFFKKLRIKNKNIDFCDENLENFIESDIVGSEMILEEIFEIINIFKKTGEKQEFVGNSFELTFYNKKVKLFNQFTEEKCKISLKKFEKKLNEIKNP